MFIGEIKGFSPGITYIATQPDMYHAELTYLNKGLKRLKKMCESRGIKTVSLPKIGAGLGKLDWNSEVKPLLESILSDCETVFNAHIPEGSDFSSLTDAFIRKAQHKINRRPRKKLNFDSPKNVFFRQIANFALAS
ncbi:macro domain-containing protein [Bacteroides acidifaciens]|uniref:macro domain-containing protein n=1 Tax=Bacteroides acidifaciens TaxID=85831 RepID=UPI0025A2B96C|nr:macro domain-containing protein [Bacteroides acidifaciens]